MQDSIISIATLIACINALTFTSPQAGQVLDPTQPLTVTWTTASDDPTTFGLVAIEPGSFIGDIRIGRDISTSSGTYIIPANTIQSYGTGFVLRADSSDGNSLATSPTFDLSVGVGAQVNGQATLITSATFTGAPASSAASSAISNAVSAASSASDAQATSTGSESSTESASESTTLSGSRTGFSTSTMSGTSRSTTHSASSTSASSAATTSANAQPRLATGGQIMLSGAGLVAGLAALLA